jgi:hypothetical protein
MQGISGRVVAELAKHQANGLAIRPPGCLGGHLNNAISLYHVFSVFLACITDLVLRSDLISKLV